MCQFKWLLSYNTHDDEREIQTKKNNGFEFHAIQIYFAHTRVRLGETAALKTLEFSLFIYYLSETVDN